MQMESSLIDSDDFLMHHTIEEITNLFNFIIFKVLCHWSLSNLIRELSNSNVSEMNKKVLLMRELFDLIRELSYSITKCCKWISALLNCKHI